MSIDRSQSSKSATRVVVLGGGPAAIAAAYWLTSPAQNDQYEVTVYCQGWRLGGKCASGRNADEYNGIEEHGLHLLMGCYQNAFATMRSCFEEWRKGKADPDNMFQSWTDAFVPQRLVTMMAKDGPGTPPGWSPWNFQFPRIPGEPGDGPLVPGSANAAVTQDEQLLIRMSSALIDNLESGNAHPHGGSFPVDPKPDYYDTTKSALTAMKEMFITNAIEPAVVAAKLKEAGNAISPNVKLLPPNSDGTTELENSSFNKVSQFANRLAILADLGVAISLGYVLDIFGKGEAGYDAVNQLDLRAWLSKHGATDKSVNSAPINAFYDLTFAAEGGVPGGPASIAAGVSLRTMLEMAFGYANAPLWKMAAGMGDTVFTPLYEVLLARGVTFTFFSRVSELKSAGTQLDEIVILNQAQTVGGGPYQPLTRINCASGKQLDVWPNQPDWAQLENGASLQADGVDFEYSECLVNVGTTTLTAGSDFDLAICGIPPLALDPLASDLAANVPAWHTAMAASVSVATQSLQLWMALDAEGLGWGDGDTILTAFAEPYDSWGNMSQVIPAESWPAGQQPGSIAYFCGTMELPKGGISMNGMTAVADSNATGWMNADLATLWPGIGPAPSKSTDILARYGQANFDLSDQYVQTPAGANVSSRLYPWQPAGLPNLYAVGDWTRTRFSGGCFESAIESGMLASRGISGYPQDIKTIDTHDPV